MTCSRRAASSIVPCACFALASAVSALAGESRLSVQVMGGWTSPWTDDNGRRIYSSGTTWGVGISYAALDRLGVVGEVSYGRLPLGTKGKSFAGHKWEYFIISDGQAATSWSAGLHMRMLVLKRRTMVAPYVSFGVDVSRMSNDLTIRDGASEPSFSYLYPPEPFVRSQRALWMTFGAGVDIKMSRRATLFVEGLAAGPTATSTEGPLALYSWPWLSNPAHGRIRTGLSLKL